MKLRAQWLAVAAVLTQTLAMPALAQNAVTVFAGFRGGGHGLQESAPSDAPAHLASSGAGSFSVDWAIDARRQMQLFGSHQRTKLVAAAPAGGGAPLTFPVSVSYLHLGGTNFIDETIGRGTYVVGGVGLTQLSPGLAGLSSELRLSMNIGLGYQWPLTRDLAVRLELRGYATLINSNGSFFCSGGCVVSIKGDTLTQGEAMAGLSYTF
jgi:hypothetical protein